LGWYVVLISDAQEDILRSLRGNTSLYLGFTLRTTWTQRKEGLVVGVDVVKCEDREEDSHCHGEEVECRRFHNGLRKRQQR